MEICPRPSNQTQIPVPANSSRSVQNMCTDFVTLSSLNKCQVQLFPLNILKLKIKQRIKTLTHQVLGILEEIGD